MIGESGFARARRRAAPTLRETGAQPGRVREEANSIRSILFSQIRPYLKNPSSAWFFSKIQGQNRP